MAPIKLTILVRARLYMSDSDVNRRQILTSNVDPRTKRVNNL